MTKEEILYKESNFDEYEGGITGVFKAMDKYAKQVAIGFRRWISDNNIEPYTDPYSKGGETRYYFVYNIEYSEQDFCIEELFNLYLNHISKTTKE